MLWPKKNSYKEFDNEKKFLRLENSPPRRPHNFSNGRSLTTNTSPLDPVRERSGDRKCVGCSQATTNAEFYRDNILEKMMLKV